MACDRCFILTKGLKNRPRRTEFFSRFCHLSATVCLHLHCLHSAPNAVFFMIVCHMEKGKRDTVFFVFLRVLFSWGAFKEIDIGSTAVCVTAAISTVCECVSATGKVAWESLPHSRGLKLIWMHPDTMTPPFTAHTRTHSTPSTCLGCNHLHEIRWKWSPYLFQQKWTVLLRAPLCKAPAAMIIHYPGYFWSAPVTHTS